MSGPAAVRGTLPEGSLLESIVGVLQLRISRLQDQDAVPAPGVVP